jgi:hypothetical protein
MEQNKAEIKVYSDPNPEDKRILMGMVKMWKIK